jgi:hypothetical protein
MPVAILAMSMIEARFASTSCAILGGGRAVQLIYVKDTSESYVNPTVLCRGSISSRVENG